MDRNAPNVAKPCKGYTLTKLLKILGLLHIISIFLISVMVITHPNLLQKYSVLEELQFESFHGNFKQGFQNKEIPPNLPLIPTPPKEFLRKPQASIRTYKHIPEIVETPKYTGPQPQGECAINLYGLPRSFGDHVLPSFLRHVVQPNLRYHCDYFVHFFDVAEEDVKTSSYVDQRGISQTGDSNQYDRGGNTGGAIDSKAVLLLENAVKSAYEEAAKVGGSVPYVPTIQFASDTDLQFEEERQEYLHEIVHKYDNPENNPYFVKSPSFTDRALINILKMWHSQDKVWNLMDSQPKTYKRVAMMRLDVIYMTPIDIYKIPKEPDAFAQGFARASEYDARLSEEHFYDYEYPDNDYAVLPGFKAYPVNDRFFVGPYEATKIWAKDRFSRAKDHVTHVLPMIEYLRNKSQKPNTKKGNKDNFFLAAKLTDQGIHDETFLAHTILPAIKQSIPVDIIVDRRMYFVRVRADGSIWLKDKPGKGQVKVPNLESALGRRCTGKKYKVDDPILQERSPAKWQIKCPP